MTKEGARIKVYKKKPAKIRIFKVIKDGVGNEAHIVRGLIDSIVFHHGPPGHERHTFLCFDPGMGRGHNDVSQGLCRIPAGNELSLHAHPVEEIYTVVRGKGVICTDTGEECLMDTWDSCWMGPDTRHTLRNNGSEDLWIVFCWIGKGESLLAEEKDAKEAAEKGVGEYPEHFMTWITNPDYP